MPENEILAKLRLKSGHRAIVIDAPESYRAVLAALPEGVELADRLEGKFDFIHHFATQSSELKQKAPQLKAAMKPSSILWVSYPKGSILPTDLKRDVVRELLEKFGLRAVSQVAIDEMWSALRFKSEE